MARTRRKPRSEDYNYNDNFINDEDQRNGEDEDGQGDDLVNEEPPTAINPYTVLELEKDATQDQIKTAYRKAALKYHPDRVESLTKYFGGLRLESRGLLLSLDKVQASEKDAAHHKFQEVAFAYAILSDPRRRSRYDTTGRTSESFDDDDDFNWSDFFRAQFQDIVTADSIAKFKEEYQGSEEEKLDVIGAYVDFEGDLNRLYETVMLSNPLDDEERYRKWIDEEIEAGRIEAYDAYSNESKKSKNQRMQKYRNEGKSAKEYAKKLGVYDKLFGDEEGTSKKSETDTSGLAALIQQRQKARAGNFLADLEAKYAAKQTNSGKKRNAREAIEEVDEPPEELFQKNRIAFEKRQSKKAKAPTGDFGTETNRKTKRTKR